MQLRDWGRLHAASRHPENQTGLFTAVVPGSLADPDGLKEGDEILAIDGRKVAGVEGDIKPGAWLFDQLADREPGESIDVEVAVRVIKKLTLRAFRSARATPPS